MFDSDRDGNQEIYVMNADGTHQTRLTNNTFVDTHPAWSPDGTKIAFSSTRSGTPQIWVMNFDGSNPVQLTIDPYPDNPMSSIRCFEPDWSYDGTMITFSSIMFTDLDQIWVMNADGSNLAVIASGGMVPNYSEPSWSADNIHIAVSLWLNSPGSPKIVTIHSNSDAGSNWNNGVSLSSGFDFAPSYSPDSSKIAFCSNRDGNKEIYTMNADGGSQTRLTTNAADDSLPSWGPSYVPPPATGNTIGTVASMPFPTGWPDEYNLYLTITSTTVPGLAAGQQVWCAASTTDFPNLLTVGATLTGTLDNSLGWWVLKSGTVVPPPPPPPPATGNTIGTVASNAIPHWCGQ